MGCMREVGTSDAGKKIFCAARETCDFMRDSRAENYYGVVNARSQSAIEVNRNCVAHQSTGQFRNSGCGQLADGDKFFRNIPLVIVDVAESRDRILICADLRSLLLVSHRHVRALGHERIESGNLARSENLSANRE